MILHIDDSMSVGDIQEKFSLCFPALKIEFYTKPHHYKATSSPEQRIDPNVTLSTIRKYHDPGNLIITSSDSAGDIETNFRTIFGLNVQMFQKENGNWRQTSKTDTYTLKELSDLSSHSI